MAGPRCWFRLEREEKWQYIHTDSTKYLQVPLMNSPTPLVSLSSLSNLNQYRGPATVCKFSAPRFPPQRCFSYFVSYSARYGKAAPMSNDSISPDVSKDTFRLQPPPSPPINSGPDNCGVRCSVSSPDPQTSRRTSVQSVPQRVTDDDRTMSIANSISTPARVGGPRWCEESG